MSLSVRWHRLEASAWVHRLLVLFPLSLTALAAWFAHAWGEEQRWTWWVVLAGTVLSGGLNLLDLTTGVSFWRVAWVLFDAVLLALLAHPDSTARLHPGPRAAREPAWVPRRPPRG